MEITMPTDPQPRIIIKHEPGMQPGDCAGRAGFVADQMACANSIPERVFEAARVCAFAFPSASAEHVADRIASFYGYTDPEARRVFLQAVEHHITMRR
jgi:hypothetical protein